MIDAYTQDLGIQSRKFGFLGLIRRDLARSYGGPGHREKGQDDIFAAQVTECNVFPQVPGQRKIRRRLTDL